MVTTEGKAIQTASGTNSGPLTPEALSERLIITAPPGNVAVQGIAQNIWPWPKEGPPRRIYGRLVLGDFSIRFSTPPEAAPQENEAVIINGVLSVNSARSESDWRATHEVILKGHVVGTWTPRLSQEEFTAIPQRDERLPLQSWADACTLNEMVILCTGTAERDINTSLLRGEIRGRPRFESMSFASETTFLNKLNQLIEEKSVGGFVIARGGGAGVEDIGNSRMIAKALTLSGIPFYTAIGHDTDVVLLDKFADEVFHTPSGFGAAWVQLSKERAKKAAQQRQIGELQDQLAENSRKTDDLQKKLADIHGRFSRSIRAHRQGVSITWPTVLVLLGLAALAAWKWFPYRFNF